MHIAKDFGWVHNDGRCIGIDRVVEPVKAQPTFARTVTRTSRPGILVCSVALSGVV